MSDKKFKVVHVSGGFLGIGSSQKEEQLIRAQLDLGYRVDVITSSHNPSSWQKIYNSTAVVGTEEAGTGFLKNKNFSLHKLHPFLHYKNLVLCSGVKNLVSRLQADIWHIHEPSMGLPAQVVCYLTKSSAIVVDQHQYATSFDRRLLVDLEYAMIRRHFVDYVYRYAKAIVSVTNGGIQFLQKYHGITSPAPHLIPIGVNTEIFKVMPDQRYWGRKKYGFSDNDKVIINTGKIEQFKRHLDLIRAFALAQKRAPTLKLMLIGEGSKDYMKIIRSELERYKITHLVTLLSFVPERELAILFNTADLAVWPLFPTVSISQAVACGKPLILSTHPSQSHYIDYGCGLSYQPKDVVELSQRMVDLASNDLLLRSFSEHNASFAKQNLAMPSIAQQYANVYAEAINIKKLPNS